MGKYKYKKDRTNRDMKCTNKKQAKIWGSILGFVTLATALFTGIYYLQEIFENIKPTYHYDMNTQWMEMEEAFNLLTEKSEVSICTSPKYSDFYMNGISLISLFSNKANIDRNIVKFSIYVNNITENLSPDLEQLSTEEENGHIVICLRNIGWGETGTIYISIQDVNFYNDDSVAEIKINDDFPNKWEFNSVLPGEVCTLSFAELDMFNVSWKDESTENCRFFIRINIHAPETGYTASYDIPMQASSDGIHVAEGGGLGSAGEINYVTIIDTSSETWSGTYNVFRHIPANETVMIPIFILPTKSCSMSIRIIFKLDDGEMITADPLYNIKIKVPYYEELWKYVNGDDLDWESLEWPYKIWFPYSHIWE